MKRRDFLKHSGLVCVAGVCGPVLAQTKVEELTDRTNAKDDVVRRRFVMTQQYHLILPEKVSGETKLWIPLPEETSFQHVESYRYSGTYQEIFENEDNGE